MWLLIAIVLFILWIGGFVVFHLAAFALYVLLIVAALSLLIHLFTGRKL